MKIEFLRVILPDGLQLETAIEVLVGAAQRLAKAGNRVPLRFGDDGCAIWVDAPHYTGVATEIRGITVLAVKQSSTHYLEQAVWQALEDEATDVVGPLEYVNLEFITELPEDPKAAQDELEEALKSAPETFPMMENFGWESRIERTKGPEKYILRFADRWARLIEAELANGKCLAQVALPMARLAACGEPTQELLASAGDVLMRVWTRRHELRDWWKYSRR